jgi:microcystin degradation protein MlrC
MRVGIIGLQHESNTFLPTPTTIDNFRQVHLLSGDEVRTAYGSSHHELGGFFAGLAEEQIEAVPIFAAWAMPSGTITSATFDELRSRLWSALDSAGHIDGLLVAAHGAAVCESHRDMDGAWLSELRERVGASLPIIGTLDPHANVSTQMVAAVDALIAYRTNPHLDQRDRGIEAARLMARTLRGEVRPVVSAAFPPVAINIERQLTSASPCRELFAEADRMRTRPGVLSNSVILGFPYADVTEMGSSILVVTDQDRDLGQRYADELAAYLWEQRANFEAQLVSIDEAVAHTAKATGPIGLLDMGDNVGGGSPADGTLLIHALTQAGVSRSFVCLYDPGSVEQVLAAGRGARLTLRMGGKTDAHHGPPLEAQVTIESLHDGKFHESQVRHSGQSHYDMGTTAIVRTDAGQTLMLTSRRMAPFSLAQLTSCSLDPRSFRALVIKGVHAPVAAYAPVCSELIRVDTPGSTRADMTKLTYHHRRRPLFPFER